MWRHCYANSRLYTGFTYSKIKKTFGSGGKTVNSSSEYTGMAIEFVPETNTLRMNEDGNMIAGIANAIVPHKWFSDNSISPLVDDFISTGSVDYRIVGMDNFAQRSNQGIYYIYLRRDELAL